MNGNVSNTVSPKQVAAITAAIDAATAAAKVKAENAANGLFSKWKGLWADVKSVGAAQEVGSLMEGSIQQLANSANMLKDGVVNVGNFYARKAGKPLMNAPHTSFNGAFNPKVVQDTFDGDEYGFKDASSVTALATEVAGVVGAYTALAQEAADRITAINAFGNPEIKAQLLGAANRTYDNLTSTAKQIQKVAETRLQDAARSYNIGDVAAFFKDAGTNFSNKMMGLASDTADLAKTVVKDPKLVSDAFTYAATGTDVRGVMNDNNTVADALEKAMTGHNSKDI